MIAMTSRVRLAVVRMVMRTMVARFDIRFFS